MASNSSEFQVAKHWAEYEEHRATCFRTTHAFEVFALVVAADYRTLAKKFVDVKGERDGAAMDVIEKEALLKARVRVCSWGPRVIRGKSGEGQLGGDLHQNGHSKEGDSSKWQLQPPSA